MAFCSYVSSRRSSRLGGSCACASSSGDNEQLRQYAQRIEDQATLQERNRIARDIHDSLGHSLTALNLQLETALKLWQSNPAKAQTFLLYRKCGNLSVLCVPIP